MHLFILFILRDSNNSNIIPNKFNINVNTEKFQTISLCMCCNEKNFFRPLHIIKTGKTEFSQNCRQFKVTKRYFY